MGGGGHGAAAAGGGAALPGVDGQDTDHRCHGDGSSPEQEPPRAAAQPSPPRATAGRGGSAARTGAGGRAGRGTGGGGGRRGRQPGSTVGRYVAASGGGLLGGRPVEVRLVGSGRLRATDGSRSGGGQQGRGPCGIRRQVRLGGGALLLRRDQAGDDVLVRGGGGRPQQGDEVGRGGGEVIQIEAREFRREEGLGGEGRVDASGDVRGQP